MKGHVFQSGHAGWRPRSHCVQSCCYLKVFYPGNMQILVWKNVTHMTSLLNMLCVSFSKQTMIFCLLDTLKQAYLLLDGLVTTTLGHLILGISILGLHILKALWQNIKNSLPWIITFSGPGFYTPTTCPGALWPAPPICPPTIDGFRPLLTIAHTPCLLTPLWVKTSVTYTCVM